MKKLLMYRYIIVFLGIFLFFSQGSVLAQVVPINFMGGLPFWVGNPAFVQNYPVPVILPYLTPPILPTLPSLPSMRRVAATTSLLLPLLFPTPTATVSTTPGPTTFVPNNVTGITNQNFTPSTTTTTPGLTALLPLLLLI
ncbi:MAG: hypothetical protein ACMUJM_14710 [bacterium]